MLAQLLADLGTRGHAALEGDEGDDGLAGGVVLRPDHGGLSHHVVVDQGGFDLGGGDAVARHVHDVVDPAQHPEVPVLVDLGAVAGEVPAREGAPVGVLVPLGITPDASQHGGPRSGQGQVAAPALDDLPSIVDQLRADAR